MLAAIGPNSRNTFAALFHPVGVKLAIAALSLSSRSTVAAPILASIRFRSLSFSPAISWLSACRYSSLSEFNSLGLQVRPVAPFGTQRSGYRSEEHTSEL